MALGRAIAAGLVAALINSVAIRVATRTGIPPGAGGLSRMVLAQVDAAFRSGGIALHPPAELGSLAQEGFHTSVGIGMAIVYAIAFQSWLPGPRWFRGLLFSQIAWLAQAFVVLPFNGAGLMGRNLSPATPWVSWGLNAVYGVALGLLYRPAPVPLTAANSREAPR